MMKESFMHPTRTSVEELGGYMFPYVYTFMLMFMAMRVLMFMSMFTFMFMLMSMIFVVFCGYGYLPRFGHG